MGRARWQEVCAVRCLGRVVPNSNTVPDPASRQSGVWSWVSLMRVFFSWVACSHAERRVSMNLAALEHGDPATAVTPCHPNIKLTHDLTFMHPLNGARN